MEATIRKIIHVAQDAIRRQDGSPAIILRDYKGAERHHEIELKDPRTGDVLAKFVYSPQKPLSCGARVWVEFDSDKLKAVPV